MVFIKAFIVGGIICVLTQILMDNTKLMPGRIMVILVCLGALLGAIGLYEPLVKFAQAGACCSAFRLWKYIVERNERSNSSRWFFGTI